MIAALKSLLILSLASLAVALPGGPYLGDGNPNCVPQKGEKYPTTTPFPVGSMFDLVYCGPDSGIPRTLTFISGKGEGTCFRNNIQTNYWCMTCHYHYANVQAVDENGSKWVLNEVQKTKVDLSGYYEKEGTSTEVDFKFMAIGQGSAPNVRVTFKRTCTYWSEPPYMTCDSTHDTLRCSA
ncbi:hypothetical protein HDV05_002923 [Chytridiales sp. JEL 0842]|nr:hypothetical protein HDV05_002923 [Chytridiales sp. JEL 0842]